MKLPIVQLSPFSHYFVPLRSKYSPQHPEKILQLQKLIKFESLTRIQNLGPRSQADLLDSLVTIPAKA
jgi:hypothetical protein